MSTIRWMGRFAALALTGFVSAQENFELGKMWAFERPPLDYLEKEYGFRPDQEWMAKVRLASLRFGDGCSASFVSPKGLIMTNHHCVRGNIAQVQGENDWVKDGFMAPALNDEVRVPGLTVQQMVRATDVTARMNEGIKDGMSEAEVADRRKANEEAILADARRQHPDLDPQVQALFQGAVVQLYQYRVFDDVRLVVAPHLQAAHFGGDPDNFTYPRFGIDFAFCRAYENGKPADTSAYYFKWSRGAEPEELVILTGNPGGTERLLTVSQLEYQRDARIPRRREMVDNRIEIMRELSKQSPDIEKALRTTILGYENAQKLWRGEHGALQDPKFMARKSAAEAAFLARVEKDGALSQKYGSLWKELAEVSAGQTTIDAPHAFQTTGGHPILAKAVAIVRAVEGGVSDQERANITSMRVAPDPLQRAFFVDHLERARRWLKKGDSYLSAVLAGREPAAVVAALEQGSKLGDGEAVKALLDGGAEAVQASKDPAIVAARAIAPLMTKNGAAKADLDAREELLGAKMGRALFGAYGDDVSPDATFTLRFSDGRVRGYSYNGTLAPWRTSFFGMFGRSTEFDNEYPFNLPDVWRERQNRLDMGAAVNFVCTVDSTGGNSGSPVINKDRAIVGLLFDGNIESMGNQYVYDEVAGRSVCVHPQAIMESLTKIYDAHRIADELWGR